MSENDEPKFLVEIEGQPGSTDGITTITRWEDGGPYAINTARVHFDPEVGLRMSVASIRVSRSEIMRLYLALGKELGDVDNAVADVERKKS